MGGLLEIYQRGPLLLFSFDLNGQTNGFKYHKVYQNFIRYLNS